MHNTFRKTGAIPNKDNVVQRDMYKKEEDELPLSSKTCYFLSRCCGTLHSEMDE